MVLRYMSGSKNKCLCLGQGNASIIGYINSHYVGCSDNRKPTLGYIFKFMGDAQSWRSRIKECTTLFITEPKYVASSEACKEVVWLSRLACDMGIPRLVPILRFIIRIFYRP